MELCCITDPFSQKKPQRKMMNQEWNKLADAYKFVTFVILVRKPSKG